MAAITAYGESAPIVAGHYLPCGLLTIRPGNNDTISALQTDPGWGNPGINGVLLRMPWTQLQTSATDPTAFDWGYPDAAFSLAESNNQFLGIEINAGYQYTPPWIFANGGASFTITGYGTVCPPWDPVLQDYAKKFLIAFAARYGSNPRLSYFALGWLGNRNIQCNFANACADNAAMLAAAQAAGFTCTDTSAACGGALTGVEIWEAAASTLAGLAVTHLPGVSIIMPMGAPAYNNHNGYFTASSNILAAHGMTAGMQDFALSATYSTTQQFATTAQSIYPTNPVGFQELTSGFTLSQIQSEFAIANQLGAWWIEIYKADLSVSGAQPVLESQNLALQQLVCSVLPIVQPLQSSTLAATATSAIAKDLGPVSPSEKSAMSATAHSSGSTDLGPVAPTSQSAMSATASSSGPTDLGPVTPTSQSAMSALAEAIIVRPPPVKTPYQIQLVPQTGMPTVYSSRSRELAYDTLLGNPEFIFNKFGPQQLNLCRPNMHW